jgi:predicted O-methyltransferase YrrM
VIGSSDIWLPRIKDRPDMFFHDSDHSYKNMKYELEWAIANIRSGGIIIADDTSRNAAWRETSNRYGLHQISSPISTAEFIRNAQQKR